MNNKKPTSTQPVSHPSGASISSTPSSIPSSPNAIPFTPPNTSTPSISPNAIPVASSSASAPFTSPSIPISFNPFSLIFPFKHKIFLAILIIFFILSLVLLFFLSQKSELSINGRKFQLEIVTAEYEREKGLSGRESLCQNCAMLFEFPTKEKQGFWMKGMKFNLDIVWINDSKIVYIAKNVSRDSKEIIIPEFEADKVLELNAGMADGLGIKEGDEIKF